MSTAQIADTIRKQIGPSVLMTLGASGLVSQRTAMTVYDDFLPGLLFTARILPFNKPFGKRLSRPRLMAVGVFLNSSDLYNVRVVYDIKKDTERVVHYETDDVDAATLPRLLMALDYDGDTILNPRISL